MRSRCAQVSIGARSTTAGARHGDHGRLGARIPRGAPRDRAFERARLSRARGCAGRCDGRGSAMVLARDVRRRCPLPTRFRRDRPRRRRRPRLGREQRPQLRHHRARRPRQDHAAGHPDAAGEPGRLHRAAHGQQGSGARARHHNLLQVHLFRLQGHHVQRGGHAGTRRLWRRGGARAGHGRRVPAARGLHRGADGANQVRVGQSPAQGPQADRRAQQGGQTGSHGAGMRGGGEQTLRPIRRDGRVRRAAGLRRRLRVRPRRRVLRRPGRRSRDVRTGRNDGRRGHVRAARRAEGEDAPAARLSRGSVRAPRVHDRARPVRRQARHRPRGERRSEGRGPGQGVDRGGGGRRRAGDGPRDQALHQQGRREAPAGARRRRGHRLRRGPLRSHRDGHGL